MADIVKIDICAHMDAVADPTSTPEDLDGTVALVEEHGREDARPALAEFLEHKAAAWPVTSP